MQLSERLSVIASLVPSGARVCDIGTDHGYLAIELIRSGKAHNVIAADICEKPLQNARKNIESSGVDSVELRLCDGFSGISSHEFDTAVIAGMGGEVISGILHRGKEIVQNENINLIFQPTTSPEALRLYLCESGFEILKEIPVYENGKSYSVMLVVYTGNKTAPAQAYYYAGKVPCDTVAGRTYIEKQKKRLLTCMNALENIAEKRNEFLKYKEAFEGLEKILTFAE